MTPATPARTTSPLGRGIARVVASLLGCVTYVTDVLPPGLRYGYVHRITRRLLQRPLPAVEAVEGQRAVSAAPTGTGGPTDVTCLLAAESMDVGGIGSVVEMLATGLGRYGVRAVVVCTGGERRIDRLRSHGIAVHVVQDAASARAAIASAGADAIQLHSAPAYLEEAAAASGLPLVPVLHNTEIHYSNQRWDAFARLLTASAVCVAVSESVRAFHVRQLRSRAGGRPLDQVTADTGRISVVPNAAPVRPVPDEADRQRARQTLATAIGVDLTDAVVYVCMARYDAQKNVAGTVSTFLRAAESSEIPLHFVMAGEPSDWVELLHADAVRRASVRGAQVHLLANSDPWTLLGAADAFLLNSFFEGWPVAATEAAAAGLPLVLSDMGGARELVARDPERSELVPNPSGPPEKVSDARVRAARRAAHRQTNRDALVAALHATAGRIRASAQHAEGADLAATWLDTMLESHADIVRKIADKG